MSVRPVPLIAHVVASNVLMFGYAELVSFSTVTATGDVRGLCVDSSERS